MAITLNLLPEEEQRLRQQAELAGQDLPGYVESLLSQQAQQIPLPVSAGEWGQMLDELGDTAPVDAPLLSEDAVSREGLSGERD